MIHLNPALLPRYTQNLHADPSVWRKTREFRNRTGATSRSAYASHPRPDFDPAADYVELLRSTYGDSFRLYHDVHGGDVIGGIFNPKLSVQSRKFKVGLGFNSAPVGLGETTAQGAITAVERDGSGKSTNGSSSSSSNGSGGVRLKEVRLNRSAVLAEVERLGHGLVQSIELLK